MKILQRIKQSSFVIGIGLTLLSLFFLHTGDSILRKSEKIVFNDILGNSLIGYFHKPADSENYGVLLLEGFGSDQVSMHSAANEFFQAGWQVFTFDFTGHGRSTGTLKLDNASTNVQSQQVISALEAFQTASGLEIDHIFLFGHSLGARVGLQAVVQQELEVAGLVLLGPQINIIPNTQSEFFTGTSDTDLSWVSGLSAEKPSVPLLIISGSLEDILPVPAAKALLSQLTGEEPIEELVRYGQFPATREWVLLPGVFHNFEIYSPRAIRTSMDWMEDQAGNEVVESGLLNSSTRRIVFWISGMVGILLFLSGAKGFSEDHQVLQAQSSIMISNHKLFVGAKFWLWLPAIVVGVGMLTPFFFLPVGLPLFNIYYVVFIGGFGVLSLILLLIGKMPGTRGKLVFTKGPGLSEMLQWRYAFGFNVLLAVIMTLYARSGWFWTPPNGDRFLWLLILTPFTAAGFWSDSFTAGILGDCGRASKLFVRLSGFFPFILYIVLMLVIGSWSGVIQGGIGLLILWIVFQQGKITVNLTGSKLSSAILQAVMLYLLILPQGVLFSF
jgi:pimeloyl-ACP methyl ester carboxylesterase